MITDISDIILITADFVLLTMDDQGTILNATPAVRVIFEKDEGLIEGLNFSELIPAVKNIKPTAFVPVYPRGGLDLFGFDHETPCSKCEYLEYLAFLQSESKVFETTVTVDRKTKWIDISVSKIQDEDEENLYFTAIINEITKRKETEQEITSLNEGLEKRVKERTAELTRKSEQIKKVIKSCSQELAHVNNNYQGMKEKQMALMEQIEASVLAEVPRLTEEQKKLFKKTFSDHLIKSMELYSEDQISDQKFMLTLKNLNELFEKEPAEIREDNLTPGQMSGADQQDVDDLLASLGM
ncbi:MAG: PAS domain S-box protein [Proteobacteria bacterium]|nr:PAS domain S-box protein [Pseudomonadota bacterium]MBU1687239.1 PAS domain S-box protein [Pseudomonadota bacterium]